MSFLTRMRFKKIFHLNVIIIVRINVRIILRNIEIENSVIFLYNIFLTAIYIIQMCNNSKLYSGVCSMSKLHTSNIYLIPFNEFIMTKYGKV